MKRILVIDDELEAGMALKLALESDGFEVTVCSDSRQALNRVKELGPDLVVTDLMMPFKSGYDVLTDIRYDEKLKDLPVILVSSVNPSARKYHFGWNEFLKKPLDYLTVRETIAKLVGKNE